MADGVRAGDALDWARADARLLRQLLRGACSIIHKLQATPHRRPCPAGGACQYAATLSGAQQCGGCGHRRSAQEVSGFGLGAAFPSAEELAGWDG